MAAAAYAFVVSLWNTLHHLLNHPFISTCLDKQHIQSLCSKLSFLEDFLERYSHGGSQQAQDLQKRISLAAYQAEVLIDGLMEIRIRLDDSRSRRKKRYYNRRKILLFRLQEVTEIVDSITEEVKKIWDQHDVKVQPLKISEKPVTESTRAPRAGDTAMVGFEEQKCEIIEMLTRGETSSRQIISITGMGGAGKTTLATSIYTELCMEYHFDIRIWVTISQDYTMRDVLLQFPICQEEQAKHSEEFLSDVHLGEEVLRKSLWNRRYLVVMDDMWSTDVWDDMQSFFPENRNHSRILVTTRLSKVAEHLGPKSVKLSFFEEDNSWKLFCQTAFKGGSCPPELLDVGKKIVKECKGLPLLITVIGGLLGKSSTRAEYWERVAEDVNISLLNSDDEGHCFRALSLSYTHLPTHLKPCFLYMGIFPEDSVIHASELINLWIAEGFLKPNEDQTLEEVAEEYLDDLVERNLILVRNRGLRGKISTCYIHDVLRDLCLKVAQEEKFFCAVKKSDGGNITLGVCRILSNGICSAPASSFTRSYFNFGWLSHPVSLIKEPQIRVLSNIEFYSQEDLLRQVNMRYLCYVSRRKSFCNSKIPSLESLELKSPCQFHGQSSCSPLVSTVRSSFCFPLFPSLVSQFWNLQTIIVTRSYGTVILSPPELWNMRQLRHVQAKTLYLEHPPTGTNCVLGNLRTLKEILNFRWSPEVLMRVPFLKKLKLRFEYESLHPSCFGLENLHLLTNLESLYIDFRSTHVDDRVWVDFKFTESLKKLTLTRFVWDAMKLLCSLPSLQVLKFRGKVQGDNWSPIEVKFPVLEYLEVEDCKDLEYWNAGTSEFPALRTLKFGNVPKLKKIPSDVGDIHTLELISIRGCKLSAAVSALEIIKEQEDFGNDSLQVRIELGSAMCLEILEQHMKDIGFTSENFLLSGAKWYTYAEMQDNKSQKQPHLDQSERDLFEVFTSTDATNAQRQGALEGNRNSSSEVNFDFGGLKAEHGSQNKETGTHLAASSSKIHSRSCNRNNKHKNNFH